MRDASALRTLASKISTFSFFIFRFHINVGTPVGLIVPNTLHRIRERKVPIPDQDGQLG